MPVQPSNCWIARGKLAPRAPLSPPVLLNTIVLIDSLQPRHPKSGHHQLSLKTPNSSRNSNPSTRNWPFSCLKSSALFKLSLAMAATADDKVRSSLELQDRNPVLPTTETPEPAKASLHPAVYVAYVFPCNQWHIGVFWVLPN